MSEAQRVVRIFVTSSYGDLRPERLALQRHVFPKLGQLCAERSSRLQVIDLRRAFNQPMMKLLLRELDRGATTQVRPLMLVLLGERYGWRPLPEAIPAPEFEVLCQRLRGEPSRLQLLQDWYSPEPRGRGFLLKAREESLRDFAIWEAKVERPLREVLLRHVPKMSLSRWDALKYRASVTEREMVTMANHPQGGPERVFVFERSIENLKDCVAELPDNGHARAYLDVDEAGFFDVAAHRELKRVKRAIGTRMPPQHRFKARWTGDGISTEHLGCLPDSLGECLALEPEQVANLGLCGHAFQAVRDVLTDELKAPANGGTTPPARRRTPSPERRASQRVAIAADVTFYGDSNFFVGQTEDISDGGLFVATYDPFPLDTELDLTFSLPSGQQINTRAVVCWLRPARDNTIAPGMGVKLKALPAEDARAVERFMRQRPPLRVDKE